MYVMICVNLENIMLSEELGECLLLGMNDLEETLGIFWNKINKWYLAKWKGQSGVLVKRDWNYMFY